MKILNYPVALLLCLLSIQTLAGCENCSYKKLDAETQSDTAIFIKRNIPYTFRYDNQSEFFYVIENQSTTQCEFNLGVIDSVFISSKNTVAMIKIASAGTDKLQFIDLATCTLSGDSIDIGYKNKISAKKILAEPYCECMDATEDVCVCESAKVFDLNADCAPKLNIKESKKLTNRIIKLEFVGQAKIRRPHSRDASFITD